MKKKYFYVLTQCLIFFYLPSQSAYQYYVDLVSVNNKKIKVELTPPAFKEDTVIFCFPAVVPGTYEKYDFGQYIKDLKVLSKNNSSVEVKIIDKNCYKIYPAKNIDKISYYVTSTWDNSPKENIVFEPAGTKIDSGSVYIINNHGFFGYFRNMDNQPFTIIYNKPEKFYPASAISTFTLSANKDIIQYNNYHELADFPVIYSVPDTTTLNIYNTNVLISCYSPNNKITSAYLASTLKELLFALSKFFEGNLPVNKYAFLFYFTDKGTPSGASGALEHNQSSLYVLPEMDSIYLTQTIKDVAAHEFLHILTPLNIHSEEIEYFDFNNPKMSKHLWLYEGTTEYHAHYLQEKEGLISADEFMNVMIEKINNTEQFNDTMPFTKMSENVLNPYYHKNYNNVYEKGALIGMCLDILLLKESKGEYTLRKLLLDLSKKYGKNRPFKDDSLFYIIEKMTYPSIGKFLHEYVSGKKTLPLAEIFSYAGFEYSKEKEIEEFTLGGIEVNVNEQNQIYITSIKNIDDFGKQFGFKEGDILYTLNNRLLTLETVDEIISDYFSTIKEGDKVQYEVIRIDKKGNKNIVSLKAKAKKVKKIQHNFIDIKKDMSEDEKFLLNKWLGNE